MSQQVCHNSIETVVCGNYTKSLQYLLDYKTRNLDAPVLPLLSGNFTLSKIDEKTNHTWKHSKRNAYYFASTLYEKMYEDDHVQITPIFERFMGTSEVILIAHSSPEAHDYQFATMQWFDTDKWFILPEFTTQLQIPTEMITYDYVNESTGQHYTLDWSQTELDQKLIRSVDQQYYVFPVNSSPMIRLTSISDGTTWYGGSEKPDYRINMTFEWDIELPAYIVLKTDWRVDEFKKSIVINGQIDTGFYEWYVGPGDERTPGVNTIKIGDSIIQDGQITYEFQKSYNIPITVDHSDITAPYDVTLPEPIGNRKITVMSYWGIMSEDREYKVKDPSTISLYVPIKKDDFISIYYYEPI